MAFISNFYNLGGYLKINRFSFKIEDESQPGLKESSTWYGLGIIKRLYIRSFFFDFKFGLTNHHDKLTTPFSEQLRLGYELGLTFSKNILDQNSIFFAANYNYENVKIPYYVTSNYSRHQRYLAGKSFNTGGYLFYIGISICLF